MFRSKFFRPFQGIYELTYTSHEVDLLEDYLFFGKFFKWAPSEIDSLKWSYRKKLKDIYKEILMNNNGKNN